MLLDIDNRLKAVASMVEIGSNVADIGTDHAYLSIYLIANDIANMVIAADINSGPVSVARRMVESYNLQERIIVRQGDGLTIIEPKEVDTICIAGMGGELIAGIIDKSPTVVGTSSTLVLQPMNASSNLRRYLYDNGWYVAEEQLVEANNKIYVIIKARQGLEIAPKDILLEIGPRIAEQQGSLFPRYIQEKIMRYKRALAGMKLSKKASHSERYYLVKAQLSDLEEYLS